jgi:predicted phosphoribosyltransferase
VPAELAPLFADRREAGRELAAALESERGPGLVVVGLARGGVEVAAEVARVLGAPLDVVAVRKVGHPWQPEYGLGAVTPNGGVYLRDAGGLTDEQLSAIVERTRASAGRLDRRLHADHPALDLTGRTALLVDDGLATGATMIAALGWAHAKGAGRVVAAVPVGAAESLSSLRAEADAVVCPHPQRRFFAVGAWYRSFAQLDDQTVIDLLAENRRRVGAHAAVGDAGTAIPS